jgi:hypothetical protein
MFIKSIVIFILFILIILFILFNNNKIQETFQNTNYFPYISYDNEISSGIQNIEYKYIKGPIGPKGDPGQNATDQNIITYLDSVYYYQEPVTTTTLAPTTTTIGPISLNKTFFVSGNPIHESSGISIGTINLPLNYEIGITLKRKQQDISPSKGYRFIAGIHGLSSTTWCTPTNSVICPFGERLPLILFIPNTFRLHIIYGTNEDIIFQNKHYDTVKDLVLNEDTNIKIKFYQYYVEIFINNKLVHFAYRQSKTFNNAKVYAFQNPIKETSNDLYTISEEVEISNFYFIPIDNPETEKRKNNIYEFTNTNTFSSYIYSPTYVKYINGFGNPDDSIGYIVHQYAAFGANFYSETELQAASQSDKDKLGHFITLVFNDDNTISFKTKDGNYLKIKYEEIGLNYDGTHYDNDFAFIQQVHSEFVPVHLDWEKHKIEYVSEGRIRIYNDNNTSEKKKYYLVLGGTNKNILMWKYEDNTSDSGLFIIKNTLPLFEKCILYNSSRNKYLNGQSGNFSDTEETISLLSSVVITFSFRKNDGTHLRIPHENNFNNGFYKGSSSDFIESQFTHLVRDWNRFDKIEHSDGTVSFSSEYGASGRYYLGIAPSSNNLIFYHSSKFDADPSNCKFEIFYDNYTNLGNADYIDHKTLLVD